ncbi:MAG TPA: PIN domain-containing protein [Candidatus Deferrimicrobium sp.]|nr:PIN domain-containing protein [Candidatus Deferrimicrobium sp.]
MEKRKYRERTSIVVDTNIVIATLRSNGVTRKILLSRKFQQQFRSITLDFCFNEVWEYRHRWNIKGVSDMDLIKILDFIFSYFIFIYPTGEIQAKIAEAYQIMKPIDEKNTPFLALALYVKGKIWSNDKHLKKQKEIVCFTTNDIMELLKIKE